LLKFELNYLSLKIELMGQARKEFSRRLFKVKGFEDKKYRHLAELGAESGSV
jgi:hypothetical protein